MNYVEKMLVQKMIELGHLSRMEACLPESSDRCNGCRNCLQYAGVCNRTPIYLAAKMTGMPEYNRALLRDAEDRLRECGFHNIYNPANLPDGWTPEDYILISVKAVQASRILVLCGEPDEWKTSGGVGIERSVARYHGKLIIRLECLEKLFKNSQEAQYAERSE